jgi:2-dehydro-3-deoxygalactonokinase
LLPVTAPPALVLGDWGTSSLRLWAVAADAAVLAERRSGEGMSTLAPGAFEAVLRGHLDVLGAAPVLLCGMVGARQGWREAPYVAVPADVGSICDRVVGVAAGGLDVRIVPGLSVGGGAVGGGDAVARCDVMRGEETQLLGVLLGEPGMSGTVVMPGTHSKWVRLEGGRVSGFETAMTGELYAVLCRHSVLRHSVGEAQGAASGDASGEAFARGLAAGLAAPQRLVLSLFGVRAASLLHGLGGEDAAAMLSGLLIGAEVGGAAVGSAEVGREVVLVAGGVLARRYGEALRSAGCRPRVVDAEAASRDGLLHVARRLWPERMMGVA